MEFSTEIQDKIAVVVVVGEIDAHTAGDVADYIQQTMTESLETLIIDLSGVNFMSSSGLRVILAAYQQGRELAIRIVLAAPQSGVLKVLNTSGFTRVISCYDSVEEAIKEASA